MARCVVIEPPGGWVAPVLRSTLPKGWNVVRLDFVERVKVYPKPLREFIVSEIPTASDPLILIGDDSCFIEPEAGCAFGNAPSPLGAVPTWDVDRLLANLAPIAALVVVIGTRDMPYVANMLAQFQAQGVPILIIVDVLGSTADELKALHDVVDVRRLHTAPMAQGFLFCRPNEEGQVPTIIEAKIAEALLTACPGVLFDFGADQFFGGFYAMERNEGGRWRWSGKGSTVGSMSFYARRRGVLELDIKLASRSSGVEFIECTVIAAGQVHRLEPFEANCGVRLPLGVGDDTTLCTVYIRVDKTLSPREGERRLGLCISPPRFSWVSDQAQAVS